MLSPLNQVVGLLTEWSVESQRRQITSMSAQRKLRRIGAAVTQQLRQSINQVVIGVSPIPQREFGIESAILHECQNWKWLICGWRMHTKHTAMKPFKVTCNCLQEVDTTEATSKARPM